MAGTLSGSITFSGLGSGTDFDAMVEQLKAIEAIPQQRMKIWKAEWETRVDAFDQIMGAMSEARSTLYGFDSLSEMLTKTVSSSNETVATATAESSFDVGTYSINVTQMATSAIYSNTTQFAAKDAKVNDTGTAQTFSYTYNGTTRTLNVAAGSTLEQFVNQINKDPGNPGVRASLIKNGTNYIFQLQGMDTGKENSLGISSTLKGFDASPTFADGGAILNTTNQDQSYTYYHNGQAHTVTITNGMTVDQFLAAIHTENPNMTASLDSNGKIVMRATDDVQLAPVNDGSNVTSTTVKFTWGTEEVEEEITDASGNTTTQPVTKPKVYEFTLAAGSTVQNYIKKFNEVAGGEITAELDISTGQISYKDKNGGPLTVGAFNETNSNINSPNFTMETNSPDKTKLMGGTGADAFNLGMDVQVASVTDNAFLNGTAGGNWYSKQATDAVFTLNGWPQELTSSSNTLDEVIEGMEITLKSTGETTLAVSNDTAALKENIKAVVDAINTLRSTILTLTKVDENKEVSEPEVNDKTGLLSMQSQFTWQKGSALTGNYGVQLLSSRLRTLISGSAEGFQGKSNENDSLNDWFTSLSQIGVTTVTDESDPEFGLLRIDEDELDKAIAKDILNVAELFASDMEGTTDSGNFSVAQAGINAKSGIYDVEYKTDATGRISEVWINGSKAATDSNFPGRWTVADAKNDAAGLAIQFPADLILTPNHEYKGETVRLKEGKVNEFINMLNDELQPVVEGNNQAAGAIPLLISNYKDVIANIDEKIDRETTRLSLWEKRQKAKFSRLETLLTQYNSKSESASAAIAQLGGNSGE